MVQKVKYRKTFPPSKEMVGAYNILSTVEPIIVQANTIHIVFYY